MIPVTAFLRFEYAIRFMAILLDPFFLLLSFPPTSISTRRLVSD